MSEPTLEQLYKKHQEVEKLLDSIESRVSALESSSSSSSAQKPGATKADASPVNDEVKALANQVRGDIEKKAGRTFKTFTPKEFTTQVVSGTNFFVKIEVDGGFVHARIYRDLKKAVSLHSIKEYKSNSPIEYF